MSLILSRMQNFRSASNLDKWVDRPSKYGAFDIFWRETMNPMGIITSELRDKANMAQGNTLETHVFDEGTISIGSTRTVTISDAELTTAMQSISFSVYEFGFTMVPAQYTNNEVAYQEDFNRKLTRRINTFLATLDTAALSSLNTNKTQVADTLGGKYTFATNILTASLANKLRITADITPIMNAIDFYEPRHVIGNPGLLSVFLEMQESGLYNEQNRVIAWADKELHFTNRLTDAANRIATGYVVNEGSLGIVTRVDRDARLRHRTHKHEFDVVNVPGIPFPMGVYRYDDVADKNTITGAATADLTRTKVEAWSFSIDLGFVVPYTSDITTYSTPILKFDIADS